MKVWNQNINAQPSWIYELCEIIRKAWKPTNNNDMLNWRIEYYDEFEDEEGYYFDGWSIYAAPIRNEIYGGTNDGMVTWKPFSFNVKNFLKDIKGKLDILDFSIASHNLEYDALPVFVLRAEKNSVPVSIIIQLIPPDPLDGGITEIFDTNSGVIRHKS